MTDLGYLTWFIATAVMIGVVLVVGTLGAAGGLTRTQRRSSTTSDVKDGSATGAATPQQVERRSDHEDHRQAA